MKLLKKESKPFKKALIVSNYHKTIRDLKNKNIIFTSEPYESSISDSLRENENAKVQVLEKSDSVYLDPNKGFDFVNSYSSSLLAYDESIQKIQTLKGTVYFTCHCIIGLESDDYDPICELTANYFTRAKATTDKSAVFHYVDIDDKNQSIESVYKKQYHKERKALLLDHIPNNSILIRTITK